MRTKGYSQKIDIVNFCGKQHNISSSKTHMALIYCQWSNDLGFITRSSNNFCLPLGVLIYFQPYSGRNNLHCIIRWYINHTAYAYKHIAFLLPTCYRLLNLICCYPHHFGKSHKPYEIIQHLKALAIDIK